MDKRKNLILEKSRSYVENIMKKNNTSKFSSKYRLNILYISICTILFLSSIFIGCKSEKKDETLISTNEHMVLATLYSQIAGENKALQLQAFNIAKNNVIKYIKKDHNKKNLAVILDIDETLLETSLYQDKIITENKYYPDGWKEFKAKAICKPTSGAIEFLNFLDSLKIKIFYVSNRPADELNSVMKNFRKYNFPQNDSSNILLKTDTNDKTPRREAIYKSYDVILLMGDNLGDFSNVFDVDTNDKRNKKVLEYGQYFGNKFIVFPNASYGEWENLITKGYFSLSPNERNIKRKEVLKKIYNKQYSP